MALHPASHPQTKEPPMDAALDVKTYIEWDTVNWGKSLDFWQRTAKPIEGARALELGANKGGLSLWLAHQGAASVLCTDVSPTNPIAIDLHSRYRVSDLIEYAEIDGMDMDFENEFDVVVFKSVLPQFDEAGKQKFLDNVRRALKPGGQALFAENIAGSAAHQAARRRFNSWGQIFVCPSAADVERFAEGFSRLEVEAYGITGAFGRTEAQRRALGHIDSSVLEKITPKAWRYMMAGVATK